MHNIDDTEVYKHARRLALLVYQETATFPRSEQFLLVNQMRKCAVSIGANLKEGAGRSTAGELRQFVSYACGSSYELEWHALISGDLGYLAPNNRDALLSEIVTMKKLLYRFRQSLP
jgi:four helix bundle protein